jgi:hypothetical protein
VLSHEDFVARVRVRTSQHLEKGEIVQDALTGQTGEMPHSMLFGVIAAVKMIRGQFQQRLVILTDRTLYVAHTTGVTTTHIKAIVGRYDRATAGTHVSLTDDVITIGDEDINLAGDSMRGAAERMVAALDGTGHAATGDAPGLADQ